MTALQALRDTGQVQPGHKVLINGAAGGVGTFAVQIAKSFGADVTGVCSTRNLDIVRSLGAGEVIDYTREDFSERAHAYDLILDLADRSLSDCRRALSPTGTLVVIGGTAGRWIGGTAGRWIDGLGRSYKARTLSPFVSHRLRPFLTPKLALIETKLGGGAHARWP